MLALIAAVHQAAALPVVAFTHPTNDQQIVTFAGLAGTARSDLAKVQSVTFSIYDENAGQWWNGTSFQGGLVELPTTYAGGAWTPPVGLGLPKPCCGQAYQLDAVVTDANNDIGTTSIIVYADAVPPSIEFTPLADGQTVPDLSAIGGTVTDNFGLVGSVVFSIHELDINGEAGRWWNGTNFQDSPATLLGRVSGANWSPAVAVVLPALNSGQSYELTATATDTTSNSASALITVQAPITVLSWDPGQTALGTVVFQRPNTNGGNYWFRIIPQNPAVGVWRTALNVSAGEADVYMSQDWKPTIYSYSYASTRAGSDGFVLDASQFDPGQDWYILVTATANAQWKLVTGDTFVHNLGTLAAGGSSSTNAMIGAEGMIFYRTTIPSDTLAWRLWLRRW